MVCLGVVEQMQGHATPEVLQVVPRPSRASHGAENEVGSADRWRSLGDPSFSMRSVTSCSGRASAVGLPEPSWCSGEPTGSAQPQTIWHVIPPPPRGFGRLRTHAVAPADRGGKGVQAESLRRQEPPPTSWTHE
jgi:hypothetical protein